MDSRSILGVELTGHTNGTDPRLVQEIGKTEELRMTLRSLT